MIRNDAEYRRLLQQVEEAKSYFHAQKAAFQEEGVAADSAEIALQATETFILSLEEEAVAYDRAKRGELEPLSDLRHIGRWLIHVRIARGLTQKQLAEKLNVSEAQVSRDERNEYHRVSVDRAQQILEVMEVKYRIEDTSRTKRPTTEPYAIPFSSPSPALLPAVGYFRAAKNLSPEKAAQVDKVLHAVFESMTEDVDPTSNKE